MKAVGVTCEEACEMVDIMFDPDPTRFMQGLAEWVQDFEARVIKKPEVPHDC